MAADNFGCNFVADSASFADIFAVGFASFVDKLAPDFACLVELAGRLVVYSANLPASLDQPSQHLMTT